jgi:hypothetical protein
MNVEEEKAVRFFPCQYCGAEPGDDCKENDQVVGAHRGRRALAAAFEVLEIVYPEETHEATGP